MAQANRVILTVSFVLLLTQACPAVQTGQAIVELMRETYDLDSSQYEIEITSCRLKTKTVNPHDLSLKPLSGREPVGPFTVQVEIACGDELIERGQVRLRIKRFAEVLVATDHVPRHQALGDRQFELKRVDVTSLREQPITSLAGIVGQRSKRNLRLGSILTTAALEPVPDIDVGREVTIVFTDTWGSITAPGRALQSGWIGRPLRVKNLATGKVVQAQAVSATSVEVNP